MDTFRCDDLCKSFDGVRALGNVRMQLPSSGITAIIGPNGAGKTTLLNVLTGFLRPDSGRCFLGDMETTRLPPHRIARLGVARTFQDLRVIFQESVLENVLLARPQQRGESLVGALLRLGVGAEEARNREQAIWLLDFVGLGANMLDLAGTLSYGQQKLLTLACCLATQARILLLDEPVAGVHPEMVAKILALLCRFRDQGTLVVFVEHDIAAVRKLPDHVIVMDQGTIISQGSAVDVLEQPEILEAYLG